jgi:hypothetical protein
MPENLKPSQKGTRPEGEVEVDVEDTDYRGLEDREFRHARCICCC